MTDCVLQTKKSDKSQQQGMKGVEFSSHNTLKTTLLFYSKQICTNFAKIDNTKQLSNTHTCEAKSVLKPVIEHVPQRMLFRNDYGKH